MKKNVGTRVRDSPKIAELEIADKWREVGTLLSSYYLSGTSTKTWVI